MKYYVYIQNESCGYFIEKSVSAIIIEDINEENANLKIKNISDGYSDKWYYNPEYVFNNMFEFFEYFGKFKQSYNCKKYILFKNNGKKEYGLVINEKKECVK